MIKKSHINFCRICLILSSIIFMSLIMPFASALIVCSNNADCDDGDLYTSDLCVSPGTDSSYCDYNIIKCLGNNDCGFNGFFGNEFCTGKDVFKFFQSSVCKNPGTISSFCEVSNSSLLIVDCGDNRCDNYGDNYCKGDSVYHSRWCYTTGCEAGICYSNQDNEEELIKSCVNECLNGACINEPNCNNDNECGGTVFLNQFFCKENNVYDNQIINSCKNPGTLDSFCSVEYSDILSQICINGCTDGICNNQSNNQSICTKDSDCGKSKTEYVCDGKDIKKIITSPKCTDNSCQTKTDETLVRTCKNECSNGVCKDGNHRKEQIDEEEVINQIKKPVETIQESDYKFNNTIGLNNLKKIQVQNSQVYLRDNYFWLILSLILVFVILVIILIVILAR